MKKKDIDNPGMNLDWLSDGMAGCLMELNLLSEFPYKPYFHLLNYLLFRGLAMVDKVR